MDGFTLLSHVEKKYPGILRVLLTGCDIDSNLPLIREHNIGNVLSKGGEIQLQELLSYVDNLLGGTVFGLSHYVPDVPIAAKNITNSREIKPLIDHIISSYHGDATVFLEIALNEIISNAVFHGILEYTGVPRERWEEPIALPKDSPLHICWGVDSEKIGISITDRSGKLTKADALRWIDHKVDEKLNEEEHGRGLLLVRKLIDRFIINIKPGQLTECIIVQYFSSKARDDHKKPLLIHELPPDR
jgi:anti-sigma regulatory factor (Ser/Thr protein kinase)